MDNFSRDMDALDKERRHNERKKKWDERGKKFWSTFLFTENGKPKSGFLVYTFCLAIAFFAIYYASFYFLVDLIAPLVEGWPVWFGNLISSLCCSAVGLIAGCLLHRWFSDKRLMLGAHLWLVLLAVASVIAMAVMLKGTGAMGEFMVFFIWFAVIPLCLGLLVFYRLYRRDYHPVDKTKEEEPEYKKYIRRR